VPTATVCDLYGDAGRGQARSQDAVCGGGSTCGMSSPNPYPAYSCRQRRFVSQQNAVGDSSSSWKDRSYWELLGHRELFF
jgi:hypothetical protein